jgi:hypothetical protein
MIKPVSPNVSVINKQTIKALKLRIRKAGTRQVERKLGFTQSNLSYHLNPKDFSKVNMGMLERIATAVAEVEEEKLAHSLRIHKAATTINQ